MTVEDRSEQRRRWFDERYEEGNHFKQVGEHHPECFCQNDAEAFIVQDRHEYRDRSGRNRLKSGGTQWLRFRCNDTKCEAVMLVRWDALSRFVTRAEALPTQLNHDQETVPA